MVYGRNIRVCLFYSKLEDSIHSTYIYWNNFDCKYAQGSDHFKYKIDTYKTI